MENVEVVNVDALGLTLIFITKYEKKCTIIKIQKFFEVLDLIKNLNYLLNSINIALQRVPIIINDNDDFYWSFHFSIQMFSKIIKNNYKKKQIRFHKKDWILIENIFLNYVYFGHQSIFVINFYVLCSMSNNNNSNKKNMKEVHQTFSFSNSSTSLSYKKI